MKNGKNKVGYVKLGVYAIMLFMLAMTASALCLPHAIQGKAYFGDNSSANGAPINVLNRNIGESLTDTVGSSGNSNQDNWYSVDLGNLENCWSDGDILNITTTKDGFSKSILFTLNSSKGGENVDALYINRPPEINTSAVTDGTEEVPYKYDVNASDADGDELTYSLTANPSGMSINSTTGLIGWTPTNAQAAQVHSVTVRVSDGEDIDEQGFSINVSNVNDAPGITSSAVTTAVEEVLYEYDVDASDDDLDNPSGDNLTFSLVKKPDGMTINPSTGLIQWIPTNEQALEGKFDVSVKVSDDETYDEQNFTISLTSVNDVPIVSDIPDQSISEGQTFDAINLSSYVADDDDSINELNWSYSGNDELNVDIDNGIATITIPNQDWVGSENITFTATDPGNLSGSDSAKFTVGNVNDAPVLEQISNVRVNETELVNITANASDIDSGSLTYSINDSRFSKNVNEFTWQTELGDAGVYQVLITVSDGQLNDSQVVTVTVDTLIYNVTLEFKQGWNLVTLPVTPLYDNNTEFNYTAETLCGKLVADTITQYDSKKQKFKGHICGGAINNFDIERGKGVFVHVIEDKELVFSGLGIEKVSVPVHSPETALGWFGRNPIGADAFAGLITDSNNVTMLNATTQSWVDYSVTAKTVNYTISQGYGLMVSVGSNSTWSYP